MYNNNGGHSNINYLFELLQPFSKEELQSMMVELAQADNTICQVMVNRMSTDIKWCKLFVHGLSPNTTKVLFHCVLFRHFLSFTVYTSYSNL